MVVLRWVLVVLVLALPGAAWSDAPETSPRPRMRPPSGAVVSIADAAVAEATAARQAAEQAEALRLATERAAAEALAASPPVTVNPLAVATSLFPRHRTDSVMQRYAAIARDRARDRQVAAPAAVTAPTRSGGPQQRGICGVRGLEGRELPRITSSTRGCGIDQPVSVTSVQGIPLSMAATIDCDTARAFDRWVRTEMVPAVGRTGGGVAQIRVIGAYSCRTRNSQPGARISEHGRGRAIDVAGYRLVNGDTVSVLRNYRRGSHSRSLRRMYEAACGIFRTTLSPDSDRFHQDHFHFDLAQHRGGGTYCR
ncbi:extensin-like domain-containing protein [Pararhodobacter zhoushanensis]|uniref:Extensin family protein n=1 Tax=Pararhodobacter zhoushanensis TaxID=2479545 RepID=A0ABT3GWZ7_9RHOB|nr:extensin family protein [Pararhodobacter zhoushanensis]MCW1932064.1 extensin family protein [Pararhodobacter zhoushanensis]